MFNFGGADAESQSAERAVRCRVTIAADDDHPGPDESEFVHNDMFDALVGIVGSVERVDAKSPAVRLKRLRLPEGRNIEDAARAFVLGRDDVVDNAKMRVGRSDGKASLCQACESLWRRVFIGKVHVAVKKSGIGVYGLDGVCVDDLSVQRFRRGHRGLLW